MTTQFDSAQRKFLKALAHPLEPVVQIGAAGVCDGVVNATVEALDRHELIKVKLPRLEREDRGEAATALAAATDSYLCQVIGRVAVLYRRRDKDLPGKKRIALP